MTRSQPRSPRLQKPKRTVSIIGTGSYVPERILTNAELERMVETSDEWIVSRTGIKERRMAGAFIAKGAFKAIKKKTNYEEYGGSPLLGVNGICIIAHGSSTPKAIKNAIRVAGEGIQQQINPHIVEEIQKYHDAIAAS